MEDKSIKAPSKIKVRKHLNADALFKSLYRDFEKIPDPRQGNPLISLPDTLMSGFAMFSIQDPSLLAFDERRNEEGDNLNTIYGIKKIPSDTRMREILDNVHPEYMRPCFHNIFSQLQRGKALEPMVFMDGCYLLSLDGTGYFSSNKLHSEFCMKKVKSKTGEVSYYLQMLGGAIVHPDFKEVIPLMPEIIMKQDGQTKNDCERNAAKRFFENLRKDHPHLPLIIIEDGLSSNAPHIKELRKHQLHFILGVKPKDHKFLFNYVESSDKKGLVTEFAYKDENDPDTTHSFKFINGVPLNQSNQDVLVNYLEYREITDKRTRLFSWITDFTITMDNAYQIMKGGRARWKIENETFNTLKNQGYHFGHNYGLGQKNLSMVFVMLMMLAFLVDQTQQLCCALFRAVWKKNKSKRALWEHMRSMFHNFELESMEMLYRALLSGYVKRPPIILDDTS
jgi:hypothetical protein